MSEFEFENEDFFNIDELIQQYEDAQRKNKSRFFDQEDFESIIEYYQFSGRYDEAMQVSDESLKQHLSSAILWIKRAQLYFELKNIEMALIALDTAGNYDPNEIEIDLLKAEIYTFQSKYQEAVDILESLLDKAERDEKIDIYLQLCDVYEDWEKYPQVYDYLLRCLALDDQNSEALNRLNYVVEITNQFEESIHLHQKIIDQHPYNYLAWYNLACAYRGTHQIEKAIEAYEYVIAINDKVDYAYTEIAEIYYNTKEYKKALDVLKDLCELMEPDDEVYFMQGKCFEAMGDMKMARYNFRKCVHENPANSQAYFRIGETYKQEGQWQQAYKAFQKAADLEKEQYEFCLAMAEAAMEINEIEVAVEACETAIDIFINRHEAYFILASIMALNDDTETALEIIDKGIGISKSKLELRYAQAAIYVMDNKLKHAEMLLLELLTEDEFEVYNCMFDFCPALEENVWLNNLIEQFY